ncbi:lasso RiPP family leader peptide-containing protein, partial [Parafrankia sp. FMc2]
MRATYEAPAIQAQGSFRDSTRAGVLIVG